MNKAAPVLFAITTVVFGAMVLLLWAELIHCGVRPQRETIDQTISTEVVP